MTKPVTTSVTLTFDPKNGFVEGGNLTLKQHGLIPSNNPLAEQDFGIKQEPDVDAIYCASDGTLELHSTGHTLEKPNELRVIQYTPYIESLSSSCTILFAVNKLGNQIGPVLGPYDEVNKRFKPSEPFFGLVRIGKYTTTYRLLRHVRAVIKQGVWSVPINGHVAAIRNNTMAILQIEVSGPPEEKEFEIYRVTSEVLTNKDGVWEKPLGWPDTPSYPNGMTPIPKPKIGLITERVHKIGMANSNGFTWERDLFVKEEQPYTNQGSWPVSPNIVKTFKESSWPKDSLLLSVKDLIQAVVTKAQTNMNKAPGT